MFEDFQAGRAKPLAGIGGVRKGLWVGYHARVEDHLRDKWDGQHWSQGLVHRPDHFEAYLNFKYMIL